MAWWSAEFKEYFRKAIQAHLIAGVSGSPIEFTCFYTHFEFAQEKNS